jgi:hypothetical protein
MVNPRVPANSYSSARCAWQFQGYVVSSLYGNAFAFSTILKFSEGEAMVALPSGGFVDVGANLFRGIDGVHSMLWAEDVYINLL